jgi:hypothetical protein
LQTNLFPFVIDLAVLASRREYLNLDKWLTDQLSVIINKLAKCYTMLRVFTKKNPQKKIQFFFSKNKKKLLFLNSYACNRKIFGGRGGSRPTGLGGDIL